MENYLLALVTVLLSVLIAHEVRGAILKAKTKVAPEKGAVISLLASTSFYGVLAVGLITSLGILGINITALVAGLGLTGFALGFALKDIISNLLAGILIILYSPFKVGDRIKVGNYEGEVVEINLRYTVLSEKGERILIPNSTMFTNIIAVKSG
jgi:small-conductance mechanosensitive channel